MAGTITHEWNGTILTITSDSGTTAMDLKGAKGDTGARGARGLPGKAGGGAAIEDGVISDETTWSSSGIVDRFAELMGTNANPAVLDNPYPNYPLQITTTFEPKQEGSGNPYPAGGGKNLLNPNNMINAKQLTKPGEAPAIKNGYGWKRAAGNTEPVIGQTNNLTVMKVNTTYTLSFVSWVIEVGSTISLSIDCYPDTLPETSINITSTPTKYSWTFSTTDEAIESAQIRFFNTNNYDVNICVVDVQLEEGSAATEYAPYANIRLISGRTGAKLTRCGKNLLPYFTAETKNGVTLSVASDGTITLNGTPSAQTNFVTVLPTPLPVGKYTMSISSNTINSYIEVWLENTDDWGTIGDVSSGVSNNSKTFETTKVYHRVKLAVFTGAGTLSNVQLKIQLEASSAASTYEPYRSDTYTADFGQTVYGRTLDWQTGVLTVDRALYTFDGSEAFIKPDWTNPYAYVLWNLFPDVVNYEWDNTADAYCSHYTASSVGYIYSNAIAGFGIYDSGHLIFSSPTHADVDAFKAYLAAQYAAGTPVQVCYKLATPQTIQLTPQEIKAIKGINTLYSNADELTVIGRVDTMYQLSKLAERVAALEAAIK